MLDDLPVGVEGLHMRIITGDFIPSEERSLGAIRVARLVFGNVAEVEQLRDLLSRGVKMFLALNAKKDVEVPFARALMARDQDGKEFELQVVFDPLASDV